MDIEDKVDFGNYENVEEPLTKRIQTVKYFSLDPSS